MEPARGVEPPTSSLQVRKIQQATTNYRNKYNKIARHRATTARMIFSSPSILVPEAFVSRMYAGLVIPDILTAPNTPPVTVHSGLRRFTNDSCTLLLSYKHRPPDASTSPLDPSIVQNHSNLPTSRKCQLLQDTSSVLHMHSPL